MARGLSPKLPISTDPLDGYMLNKTYGEVVTQNLKNIILTAPGERIMDPSFGVGLRNFLFEPNISPTHSEILQRIHRQVSRYMPFLEIEAVIVSPDQVELMDPDSIKVEIRYFIRPLQFTDVLEIIL